jgi:hypothetical protein
LHILSLGFAVWVPVALGASAALQACGGDDTTGQPPLDATAPDAADGSMGHGDTSTVETGPQVDSGADVVISDDADAGPSTMDADAQGPDTGDDGGGEGGAVVPEASDFVNQVTQALCERIRNCCGIDAGSYLEQKCVADFAGNPLDLGVDTPFIDGGTVAYNPVQAATCLSNIRTFPCGVVNASDSIALQQTCSSSFRGTVPDGGACTGNAQCGSTEYCTTPIVDGGTGSCVPLQQADASCTRFDGTECSYLGLGMPGDYCDLGSHTCQPLHGVDAGCTTYTQCVTLICRGPAGARTCATQYSFTDPAICGAYTATDAGDAGAD